MRHSASRLMLPLAMLFALGGAEAAQVANVAASKHNLAAGSVVSSADTDRVCVFCHTPHGATQGDFNMPLWNRTLSTKTYTPYPDKSADPLRSSIDATLGQPGGSSKLCLACHDGTIAIGKVNVFNGTQNVTLGTSGTDADGTMPAGAGADTGFTRDLGFDLSNDHPISFTYNDALATTDGELRRPSSVSHIASRIPGATKPTVPLENDELQCISCHDPHVVDSADPAVSVKFIRVGLRRFQENDSPGGTTYSATDDIICLACHRKDGWSKSAHAYKHASVAQKAYDPAAAALRDFPTGIQVWQAACLNCHDTHTVQGARKLLREGTDDTNNPKVGGNPAQEETCYQCHSNTGGTLASQGDGTAVPDIKGDFGLTYRMPITGTEVHAITDKDLSESPNLLGKSLLSNRHAECTDCHNPHRVIKNRKFNDDPATPAAAGTHEHTAGVAHSNIASGALAGATGVEPNYGGNTAWGAVPVDYALKKGYAAPNASTAASSTYVTREYQVCLKCHSDYAWPNSSSPPNVGPTIGTAFDNGLTAYTNQAMEFQAPTGQQNGTVTNRSWHPVMDQTGRTTAIRDNMNAANFLAPWNTAVGTQTMYCSDCHGSDTAAQTVVPTGGENGNPWGPHGSTNPFLLKGTWDKETGAAGASDTGICFKCHDWNQYANKGNTNPQQSGFSSATNSQTCQLNYETINLHIGHAARLNANLECTWCHVAVPHGWKNKALLVDIPAASAADGVGYTNPPYYLEAALGAWDPCAGGGGGGGGGGCTTPYDIVINWKASGQWTSADCGGRQWMNNSCNPPP